MNREAELLDQITDLKAQLIVAKRDAQAAEEKLEHERWIQRQTQLNPDEFLHVLGIKNGDFKALYKALCDWNALDEKDLRRLADQVQQRLLAYDSTEYSPTTQHGQAREGGVGT